MPEDYTSYPASQTRSGGGVVRVALGSAFLAFVAGAALVGWLVWDGRLVLPGKDAGTVAAGPELTAPAPTATPTAAAAGQMLEQQMAALEQRLARIDLQAAASEGNTARAEALLVALAARRAIERGVPLGYLEDQLRLRFGTARPEAVGTIIGAAQNPVTLDRLAAELDKLAPQLTGVAPGETGWVRLRRQLSGLFVVHRDRPGSDAPSARLDQARLLLRSGQIEAAADEVARLPTSQAASDWLTMARRYAQTQVALDQIEQTALAEPEKLKGGTGETVRQPGPSVSPSATPAAGEASF